MLYVARRRAKRRTWRAAKVALVATSKVGVGPGVKTLVQRSSTNDPMVVFWLLAADNLGCSTGR